MNIPPIHFPATHALNEPIRPSQQAPQDIARPVAAPNQAEAATQEARRKEERQQERSDRDKSGRDLAGRPELSEDDRRKVEQMQERDREVRAHEAAHQAAAGRHARGGASYEYETGPDGKRYAVGGEVQIDTSKVANDPQATLAKARTIQRAARAPAEPSAQDHQVAQQAAAMAAEAQREISAARQAEMATNMAAAKPRQADDANQAAGQTVGQILDVFA